MSQRVSDLDSGHCLVKISNSLLLSKMFLSVALENFEEHISTSAKEFGLLRVKLLNHGVMKNVQNCQIKGSSLICSGFSIKAS